MGSMIHLAVGRLEVDWGKNQGFRDHSALFQETDVKPVPYYYGSNNVRHKEGLEKPLKEVVQRIALMGHTLEYSRKEFEYLSYLNSFDPSDFTFDDLAKSLAETDVSALSVDYESDDDPGEFFQRQIAERLNLQGGGNQRRIDRDVGMGMENLSAYTVLRLLAENPTAQNLPVQWAFSDLQEGGWARRDQFVKPLDQANRFLIVTEGSSDAHIIRHAFQLLRPHVADFFDFLDMQNGYPFSGTGSMVVFAKGLKSIKIINKALFLFDNDASGVENYNKTLSLGMPDNIKVLKLPDRPEFDQFPTVGPTGQHNANINGKAVAIECFLDVGSDAAVQWTSYNDRIKDYQGELVGKEHYTKVFTKLRSATSGYDVSKIETVLDMIIAACASMRESEQMAEIEKEIAGFEMFEVGEDADK